MSHLVATRAQAAEALETSDDNLLWLKQERGLPFVYVSKTIWVVPWKQLDEWIASEVGRNALAELREAS